jgi:hypothetical protein
MLGSVNIILEERNACDSFAATAGESLLPFP